jgi:acetylornithine/N-succinyldiaminopimelate aminotransferase
MPVVEENPPERRVVDTQEIIDLEQQYVLQTYKRPPFVLERGEGVYLYDAEGRRYLDFVSGIAVNALGYGDPEVLQALGEQAGRLMHASNLYHTAPQALLARDLVQRSFADRAFFCNSGTEACEAALKFARKWQRVNHAGEERPGIVAFEGSFHGRTMGALSATHREKYRQPFEPLLPGVSFAPFNDVEAARAAIGPQTGAVIVEPLQGEGGVNPATGEFLRALREAWDAVGALLIFDEVQCGLGRTGTLWAHEAYGVTPDLMTLAKPLGGGLPIGAVLMTQCVADAIVPGDHGSTFAANPAICAVARVVVRRLSEPGFLAGVRERGSYLEARLGELKARRPLLVAVRGRGLIWGLELAGGAAPLVGRCCERGLIVTTAGERVLRLLPPLVVTEREIDEAVAVLDEVLLAGEA